MSRFTLSTSFIAMLALCMTSDARADRLLAPAAMPETQLTLVSDSSARAFDHIRAARQQIESRLPVEARRELVEARKLLAEARAAIPANRVLDRIAGLLARLEDPTRQVAIQDLEPLMAEIDMAGAGDAYDATRRYVERSRYYLFYGNRDAASRELVAAAARVPYGRLDAPLGTSYERVNQAMVFLFDHDLVSADAVLQAAENNAHAVIQIAAGAEEVMLPDVAAPPEPMAVEIIEQEIAPVAPFDAPPGAEEMGEGIIVEDVIMEEMAPQEAAPKAPFDPAAGAEGMGEAAQGMGESIVEEAGEAVDAMTPKLPPVEAAPKAPAVE